MAKQLDPYRDWLGIAETARPLDHYQLLRLNRFEDDRAKIRGHYRKMNAHVRKYATGEYAEQSQALLNELAKAMLCLTDAQRKREYDASLGRKDEGGTRRRAFDRVLVVNKVIDEEQLAKAKKFADAVGLELRDAVLQQKMAAPDAVMLAYAESIGLPYVELDDLSVDESLAPQIPPSLARQQSCVPVMVDGGTLLMASPNPLVPDLEEDLRLRFDMPVRTVLCTPGQINGAIAKYYPPDAVEMAPAAGKKAKGKKPAKAAAPKEPSHFTPEEQIRRRGIAALVAFNVTIVVYMLYQVFFNPDLNTHYFGAAVVAVVLGLVVGGATFGIMVALKK